jgi:malonyl-CoA O-methyltransferase
MSTAAKDNAIDHLHSYEEKQRIASSFSRAATSYDKKAIVQKEIASTLFDFMAVTTHTRDNTKDNKVVLDLGCASGVNTSKLSQFGQNVISVDISQSMLEYAASQHFETHNNNFYWVAGDAENMPFSNASIDLIYSSMAMQWCNSPVTAIEELCRVLKPQGQAFVAIMLGSSMHELHNAYEATQRASRVNYFFDAKDWLQACLSIEAQNKIELFDSKQMTFVEYHPSYLAMLRSLKHVGAGIKKGTAAEYDPITKAEIRAMEQHMHIQALNSDSSVKPHLLSFPLSYQVVFIGLKAKSE